jgi:hypothetical protein
VEERKDGRSKSGVKVVANMSSFVSRLVACLVAVVAVLQLVHLVLLNQLETRRLDQLTQIQHQFHPLPPEETPPSSRLDILKPSTVQRHSSSTRRIRKLGVGASSTSAFGNNNNNNGRGRLDFNENVSTFPFSGLFI